MLHKHTTTYKLYFTDDLHAMSLQVEVVRVYVGTFMTSLDMSGFSLSVCSVDDERTAALDADTQVYPWFGPACCRHHKFHCTCRQPSEAQLVIIG